MNYEELMKDRKYNSIANILMNNNEARKDNRVLLKEFYRINYGMNMAQAFDSNEVPNYQSIDRMARRLKQLNHSLRYDKSKEIDKYKQIGVDIPVSVRLF